MYNLDVPTTRVHSGRGMWEAFAKLVFYVTVGIALAAVLAWYIGSARETFFGGGELVIPPFSIAGSDDGQGGTARRSDGENAAGSHPGLATRSERCPGRTHPTIANIVDARNLTTDTSGGGRSTLVAERTSFTSIPLFATPLSLKTRLFERAEIKLAVGGLDVGGLIPWFQRLLVNRRTLEFTSVRARQGRDRFGSLDPLGFAGQALRLMVEKSDGKFVDLDLVATRVAAELMRRRLATDPRTASVG